jgi:hypothetical protein
MTVSLNPPSLSRRTWVAGLLGVLGGVVFTLGWLVAGLTQGSAYSVSRHDISDMGAVGAPHAWILLTAQGVSGACTLAFGWLGFRAALQGVRGRTVAATLLAVPLGVGNLSDAFFRIDCRAADGCSSAEAVRSWHATIHAASSVLILVAVVAPFLVARCLRRSADWADLSGACVWLGVAIVLSVVASVALGGQDGAGYAQRAFALLEVSLLVLLARRVMRLASPRALRSSGAPVAA